MKEMRPIIDVRYLLLVIFLLVINAIDIISATKPEKDFWQMYDTLIQGAAETKEYENFTNIEAVVSVWGMHFAEDGVDNNTMEKNVRELLMQEATYIDQFESTTYSKIEMAELLLQKGPYKQHSFE